MFRVLLREIEDLCSFPTLDVSGTSKLQAEGNCLEDQRLLLLPWVESGLCPVLQQRVQLKTSSAKHCLCITFSYGFTWLESKYFCWHFATLIEELLKINSLSKGSVMKLHTLAFVAVKFRDAVSIYSRVEVRIEQVEKLKTSCQHTPGSLTSDAWASIQCRVERQSMLSWLSMWKTNAMPKRA